MIFAIKEKLKCYIKQRISKESLLYKIGRYLNRVYTELILHIDRKIFKKAFFLDENELWMASLFPKKIIDKTIELINPKTVLDLGCGVGKSLDYFLKKMDVMGVEGSDIAIYYAKHPEVILQYNLEKELNLHKKFDLIWSYEFVEHIYPKYINNLMKTFSNHSDTVVMSAAQPGQEGDGHFNEQPDSYWIAQFKRYGYSFNENKTGILRKLNEVFAKNMYVFER